MTFWEWVLVLVLGIPTVLVLIGAAVKVGVKGALEEVLEEYLELEDE